MLSIINLAIANSTVKELFMYKIYIIFELVYSISTQGSAQVRLMGYLLHNGSAS